MCIIEEAVEVVLSDYNSRGNASAQSHEYGWLFWRDMASNELVSGSRVDSPDTNAIKLYPEATKIDIITQTYYTKKNQFVGEFHAHPKGNGTWVGQLPSPDDIVCAGVSVAGSMWELNKPINGIDAVNISPEFQIIQSLFYGDLIVLQRGPDWSRFSSVPEQKQVLTQILTRYSKWHQDADHRLGRIVTDSHEAFFQTLSIEAKSLGTVLGSRFTVEAVMNNREAGRATCSTPHS